MSSKYIRLRFKHLRLVEVLHRTGGIAHAAEELGVTQSAATKILQDVESIFGAEIFHRSSRGLTVTPAGGAVVEYATRFINDTKRVASDVEAITLGGAGSVAIGTIMGAMPHILPRAVAELRRRKPLLTINLAATTSDEVLLMLQQRRLEIGLCRLTHASQQREFQIEELFTEQAGTEVRYGFDG
jgi:molybdate transport repressor ModE-like protein